MWFDTLPQWRIRAQDYLAGWIDHLAMSASGLAQPTHLIGYDRKGRAASYLPALTQPEQAKALLAELVRLFVEGMNRPLAYFPHTALAAIEAGFNRGQWVDDQKKPTKNGRYL